MTWRHDLIGGEWTRWSKRRALTIDCSASTTTPVDVAWVIPAAWDSFWESIDANGHELRVCAPNGTTLLTYEVTNATGGAFDRTNRDGRIRIEGLAVTIDTNARVKIVWLYYDAAGASDGASGVTISGALNAYLEVARPGARALSFGPEDYQATQPRNRIGKAVGESIFVTLDVTDLLRTSSESMSGALALEELAEIGRGLAVNNGVSANTGMYDHAKNRIYELAGRAIVRLYLTAGADGTDYTVIVPLITSQTQTIEARFMLAVRDTNED